MNVNDEDISICLDTTDKCSFKKLIRIPDVPHRMANQSIRQISCMMCEILVLHAAKNTFDAFYINRNCSLSARICWIRRRNDPINISIRLLSRIMNSARLCIRETRGFERFRIGGSSVVYIIPRDTLFAADTSSWGNASFLRSSESQEFDVLFSFHGSRNTLAEGCESLRWRDAAGAVLHRPFHPVAGAHPQFLVFYAPKKPPFPRIWCTFILSRRYSAIFPIRVSWGVESTLILQFLSELLITVVFCIMVFFYCVTLFRF